MCLSERLEEGKYLMCTYACVSSQLGLVMTSSIQLWVGVGICAQLLLPCTVLHTYLSSQPLWCKNYSKQLNYFRICGC